MKLAKNHILCSLVVAILAKSAQCEEMDNASAEEESDGPEEVEEPVTQLKRKPVSYHAYKVLEVTPETTEQVTVLKALEGHPDAPGFEFWKGPHLVNETCSLSVSPNLVEVMQAYLDMKEIRHKVVVDDLQELIEKERREYEAGYDEELAFRDPVASQYSHTNYNNLHQGPIRIVILLT